MFNAIFSFPIPIPELEYQPPVLLTALVLIEGFSYDDSNVKSVHLLCKHFFFRTRSFTFIIYNYNNTLVFLKLGVHSSIFFRICSSSKRRSE